ncbi:hypothetical protein D3C72_2188190 [compost metagenome]
MEGMSSTGITWPRRLTTPSEWGVVPAIGVMLGMATISRILNTLMPKSSDLPRAASTPKRNSSSSNLLVLVRLVRSSISCCTAFMMGPSRRKEEDTRVYKF